MRLRLSLAAGLVLAACGRYVPPPLPPEARPVAEVVVPAQVAWTPTGVFVADGDVLEVWATGAVRPVPPTFLAGPLEGVAVEGTYRVDRELAAGSFPLAAGRAGPAPFFSLLGRAGDGPPFLIGGRRFVRVEGSGELRLGVNDDDVSGGEGAWRVGIRVHAPDAARPVWPIDDRPVLAGAGADPRPVEDPRVLIVVVDGLRHDVLREMAFAGYLPRFREVFFDGGIDLENAFTIAPSATVPAAVSMMTGCWPDRTGIAAQVVIERGEDDLEIRFGVFDPVNLARRFRRDWWQVLSPPPGGPRLLESRVEDAGHRFASGILPVLAHYPPDAYTQRASNEAPLFGIHRVPRDYHDAIETAFALEDVIDGHNRVMMVWYSGVDATSHASPRGLWGEARIDLARIDAHFGRLLEELEEMEIRDRTYLVLVADHGMSGGRDRITRNFDLGNEFFYASLADDDGNGHLDEGAGLGLNVLSLVGDVPVLRTHTDLPAEDFAVCAAQAYTAAWIALPRGHALGRDWSTPNSAAELASYRVHDDLAPVDVVARLLALPESPVAQVLVPAPPDAVLAFGTGGRRAVIERRRVGRTEDGRAFEYRYRPLAGPGDPFGYLDEPAFRERLLADPGWLERWHPAGEWLETTAATRYPDAVVGLAHQLLEDPLEPRFDPRERYDALVLAGPGWNFAPEDPVHVDHGGPDRESARIPFLVAGPGLARGVRVPRPVRMIDVLPTVLELAAIPYDPAGIDGRPVREIWMPAAAAVAAPGVPVTFHVDHGLPLPAHDERPEHPPILHDLERWYDPHVLIADLAALPSQELVRLADRGIDLAVPGGELRPLDAGFEAVDDAWHSLPPGRLRRRPAELLHALRLRQIVVSELRNPETSLQNIDRAAGLLEWTARVLHDPFEAAGSPVDPFLPVEWILEWTAEGLLDVRRVAVELVARGADLGARGIEAAVDATAGALDDEPWRTPRFRGR